MRKCVLALVVLPLPACEEPAPALAATIGSLTIRADPALPEGLATIDLTVDLEARNGSAEVTLQRVTAFALPRDDDAGIDVSGVLMNPQGAGDPVVRLDSGELVTVRVTNGSVTSGTIAAWCQRPAQVEVEFEGNGLTADDSADATVLCP
jgi:hypothetical protein